MRGGSHRRRIRGLKEKEIGMDALLVEVLERGWSGRRRREFIARYGRTIRGSILYHIRLKFGEQSLASIGDYLLSLQEGRRPRGRGGMVGELLDLAADTWQDVLNEAFKVRDNLIHKYHRYIARAGEEGRGLTSFSYFLSKSVQYKFLDNLKARLAKRDRKIPEGQVHGSIPERGAATADITVAGGNGIGIGIGINTWEGGAMAGIPTDTEIEKIPLNDEINYYWDQLIRCLEPEPEQVEVLVKLQPNEGNVLCWACARLKRGLKRREQRENLVAFIVFYASKRGIGKGGGSGGAEVEGLSPENLSLERVVGRDLRWREDICGRIFKKYIRQDRVMEQIRQEILKSDYSYLIKRGRIGP